MNELPFIVLWKYFLEARKLFECFVYKSHMVGICYERRSASRNLSS